MNEMYETDPFTEIEQISPRRLPPPDMQEAILQNLRRHAEQFMQDPTEYEIAGYITLMTTDTTFVKDPLSTEFVIISGYNAMILRQFGNFARLIDTPEKRLAFARGLSDQDMNELRIPRPESQAAFEALLEEPEPNMFVFLVPFDLQRLFRYLMMQGSEENAYRTRRRAGQK